MLWILTEKKIKSCPGFAIIHPDDVGWGLPWDLLQPGKTPGCPSAVLMLDCDFVNYLCHFRTEVFECTVGIGLVSK